MHPTARQSALCALTALLALGYSLPAHAKLTKEQRESIHGLATTLKDAEDPRVAARALLVWGEVADRKEREAPLKAALTHKEASVRLAARVALLRAGDRASKKLFVEELAAASEPAMFVQQVLSVLPDKEEAKLLDGALDKLQPAARKPVMVYLAEQRGGPLFDLAWDRWRADEAQRAEVTEALLFAHNPASLGKLKGVFTAKPGRKDKADATALQRDAMQLIGQHLHGATRAEALGLLRDGLNSKNDAIVRDITLKLVQVHDAAGVQQALDRAAAAKEAGERVTMLDAALSQVDYGIRPDLKRAEALLNKFGKDPAAQVKVYQVAAAAQSQPTLKKLLNFFESTTYEERMIAAQALGYSNSPAVAQLLSRGLTEGNPAMREHVATSIGQLRAESQLDALVAQLNREQAPQVRAALLRAIGRIDSRKALNTLRAQTMRADASEKKVILDALAGQKQDPARTAQSFKLLARDSDPGVRWRAFVALHARDASEASALKGVALSKLPDDFMEILEEAPAASRRELAVEILRGSDVAARAQITIHMLNHRAEARPLLHATLTDERVDEGTRALIAARLMLRAEEVDRAFFTRTALGGGALSGEAAFTLTRYELPALLPVFEQLTRKADPGQRIAGALGMAIVNG